MFYKVVNSCRGREDKQKYFSAFAYKGNYSDDANYTLWYEKGKITKAKPWTLGVFCFNSLEGALIFMRSGRGDRVFKVKGYDRKILPNFVPSRIDDFKDFYEGKHKPFYKPPRGTVLFGSIKLEKLVRWRNIKT
jgi:hypothetical protein